MIFIDYNDKRSLYEQVVDRFQTLILSGALEADSRLPSVRSLAIDLSINPNTIQRAYSELEREGFIYSIKGRGNFVKADDRLLLRQKEKLLSELEAQIINCMTAGISEQDILTQVNAVCTRVSVPDKARTKKEDTYHD